MENKELSLEAKYQKLATEYSKIRSQATVLKKAVLDEQSKNIELNDSAKKHEQTIRKHGQEMESLTFRNEQLTKRILVLQQELKVNSHSKKGKTRNSTEVAPSNLSVVDEELQKKILENAQLVSSMADKDYELAEIKEKNELLEIQMETMKKCFQEKEDSLLEEIENIRKQKQISDKKLEEFKTNLIKNAKEEKEDPTNWKEEAERWKLECELLHSKPEANDEQLTEYYEDQFSDLFESRLLCQSETKALLSENMALNCRLENIVLENQELQESLDKSNEELFTIIENYKFQLDAMTEHLAAQNDKITRQCDEIQDLKMKLAVRK